MRSAAGSVDAYIAGLPRERQAVVKALRALVLAHLPPGYAEAMTWGMPCYEVPLSRYPDTYNGKPLHFAAFAAQASNYALYLTSIYGLPEREKILRDGYAAIGRKPDMGKSCLRFQRLDQIPLEAIGRLIETMPVDAFIARHEAVHGAAARARASARAARKAPAAAAKAGARGAKSKSPAAANTRSAAATAPSKKAPAPRNAASSASAAKKPAPGKPAPASAIAAKKKAAAKRG